MTEGQPVPGNRPHNEPERLPLKRHVAIEIGSLEETSETPNRQTPMRRYAWRPSHILRAD